MNVLFVEPGKEPEVRRIDCDLRSMEELVGDRLEVIELADKVLVICGKDYSRHSYLHKVERYLIGGAFFLCKNKEDGDFGSLPVGAINKYRAIFKYRQGKMQWVS